MFPLKTKLFTIFKCQAWANPARLLWVGHGTSKIMIDYSNVFILRMCSRLPKEVLCSQHATTSKDIWFHRRREHKLTSPVLQAEEVVEVVADERRDLLQVVGSNPGRQERLVGVSEGGVHQQQPWVGTHGLGEARRTVTQKHVAETQRRLAWGRSYSQELQRKVAEK